MLWKSKENSISDQLDTNFLLIQADQLKPQILKGYGGVVDTPHLDRLCDLGVLFENAYCNFPLCAPSRFSMLAGMCVHSMRKLGSVSADSA